MVRQHPTATKKRKAREAAAKSASGKQQQRAANKKKQLQQQQQREREEKRKDVSDDDDDDDEEEDEIEEKSSGKQVLEMQVAEAETKMDDYDGNDCVTSKQEKKYSFEEKALIVSAQKENKTVNLIEDMETREEIALPVYYMRKKQSFGSSISKAITTRVWSDMKFVSNKEALDKDDDFAVTIMNDLNITPQSRQTFWFCFGEEARKRFVKKRANVVTAIRKKLNIGKLLSCVHACTILSNECTNSVHSFIF